MIPFFAFPAAVRRIFYTTNAIESLHSEVRKAVRVRGHFPNDEAATKLIWLALRNITAKWNRPPIAWHAAKAQFAIQFEEKICDDTCVILNMRLTHKIYDTPARTNQRSMRECTCCCTAATSVMVSVIDSAQHTCPSALIAITPSITQQWKCT